MQQTFWDDERLSLDRALDIAAALECVRSVTDLYVADTDHGTLVQPVLCGLREVT